MLVIKTYILFFYGLHSITLFLFENNESTDDFLDSLVVVQWDSFSCKSSSLTLFPLDEIMSTSTFSIGFFFPLNNESKDFRDSFLPILSAVCISSWL